MTARYALVITDMNHHQLDPSGGMIEDLQRRGVDTDYFERRVRELVVPRHMTLIAAAHRAGAPVIHTSIGGFRADYGDLGPNVRGIAGWGPRAGAKACEIIDELAPQGDDIFLIKTGSSSFHTSPLDIYLRNLEVNDVFYTGVITNGCVLATAVAGFDLGYRGHLVADATATPSQRLQDMAEELLGIYTAAIIEAAEAVNMLEGRATPRSQVADGTWRQFARE